MPFQVFRRHRRKMIGLLAILAMFAFVLADSLPQLTGGGGPGGSYSNEVVAELYGQPVRENDIQQMRAQRARANYVLSQLVPYFGQQTFGGTSTEEMIDALILQKEADQLGIPASPGLARSWIYDQAEQRHEYLLSSFGAQIGLAPFDRRDVQFRLEEIYKQAFSHELTDVQLLSEIANQIRLQQVRDLAGQAFLTPLDVFDQYRDARELVSANFVSFPVSDYLGQVKEPSDSQLRDFYEAHKDRVPDPSTGTVGFRIPRRIRVEFLTLGTDLLERLRQQERTEQLAEEIQSQSGFREELLQAYRQRQQARSLPGQTPLPVNLFAGDTLAEKTPPPRAFVNEFVEQQVEQRVEENIQTRISRLLEPVKNQMIFFADEFSSEDLESGQTIPEPPKLNDFLDESARDLKALIPFTAVTLTRELAEPETRPEVRQSLQRLAGLNWSDAEAERVRQIAEGSPGLERPDGFELPGFAEELFEPEALLLDPMEFTDPVGRRFLAWSTQEIPPTTPPFDRVRTVVAEQWKTEQARELARKAAEAFAEKARAQGSDLAQVAEGPGKSVQSTAGRSKMVQSIGGEARANEIIEIPNAGDEIRDAIFTLEPGTVAVAPDRPKNVFYALALRERDALADAPEDDSEDLPRFYREALGSLRSYQMEALMQAERQRFEDRMTDLRAKAGLPANWTPPEDRRRSRG
ncbi:hypothetical protein BH23PLA1_BH23PLA1_17040 [soil metagenome]